MITSARYALCLLTASGVLLSGRASSDVGSIAQTTRVEYYPSYYELVSHLRSTGNAVRSSTITGAITGSLLGGLAGGLASDENRGRSTVLAAVDGTLASGAAGYYMGKQKQISDDHARINSYATGVSRSTAEISRSVAYTKSAQSCYRSQFKALLDDHKNKSVNEAEGHKRLAEIVSGLQEINTLLVAAGGRAGENTNNYIQTYEKDLQQVGMPRTKVTKIAETGDRASTTKGGSKPRTDSNPKVSKEAVATKQTIHKAQDAQNEGNKVASRGQDMIQEACNSPDMDDWVPPSRTKA